jgi:hypothetical protein
MTHLCDETQKIIDEGLPGPDIHMQAFLCDEGVDGTFSISVFGCTPDVVCMDLELNFDENGSVEIDCDWERGLGHDFETVPGMRAYGISTSNSIERIDQFIRTFIKKEEEQ